MKTLLIGFGNIDRQDDGVAWHILRGIASRFGTALPQVPEETEYWLSDFLPGIFSLQLTPESAEIVSQFDRVIFIDAHTGNIEETLHIESLNSHYQTSPFTHHLTPQTCLALAETLYGKSPQGILVSVRGYKFGFSQELSTKTQALAAQAIGQIMKIIEQTGD